MDGFLTRTYGGLPMWVWVAIGVGGVLLYRSLGSKSGATSASNSNQPLSGNNGNATPPNIFFLPQGANAGTNLTVSINRNPGTYTPPVPTATQIFTPPPAIGGGNSPAVVQAPVTVQRWPGVSSGGLAEWDTTLWGIANHFGTSVSALQQLNNISNPNLIYPGEQIKVS